MIILFIIIHLQKYILSEVSRCHMSLLIFSEKDITNLNRGLCNISVYPALEVGFFFHLIWLILMCGLFAVLRFQSARLLAHDALYVLCFVAVLYEKERSVARCRFGVLPVNRAVTMD